MKYKLIKTYPDSPELDTIIIASSVHKNKELYNTFTIWGECNKNTQDTIENFNIKNPENYPEFWEEIKEELCVPVGTKFIVKGVTRLIYTLIEVHNNIVRYQWESNGEIVTGVGYTIKQVNDYFKKGSWVIYDETLDKKCLSIYDVTNTLSNYLGDDVLMNITILLKTKVNKI